jgi:predicted acylesterase/phospholipase RssA
LPKLAVAIPRLVYDLAANWRDVLVLDTLTLLVRHLPHGIFSLDGLEAYVRHVLTQGGRSNRFPHLRARLLVPTTVLDSGATHVFGMSPTDPTPVSAAVAASAAVPLLFEPVRIEGVDYVDAAVGDTAHLDLAVEHCAGLVVVVNPMRPVVVDGPGGSRIRDGGMVAIAGQALRIIAHRRLRT